MEYILEMKGITKRFSGVTALSNVDLKLTKGEVHTLLGENGAGKSTLMKILSGVYTPDEGQIILKGKKTDIKNPKSALFLTALATNLPLANAYRHIAPKSNANAAPVPKHLFLASHPALA